MQRKWLIIVKAKELDELRWNSDLIESQTLAFLLRANVRSIEIFLMQSQLKQAGHVIRIWDDRIPKIPIYCQSYDTKRNIRRPYLRYSDKLKNSFMFLGILVHIFEQVVSIHKVWKAKCPKLIKKFKKFIAIISECWDDHRVDLHRCLKFIDKKRKRNCKSEK